MAEFDNSTPFFGEISEPIRPAGVASQSSNSLGYRVYDPDRLVAGKRMEDHLRIAVCYWHSFCWPGSDVFGVGTFDRPWLDAPADASEGAWAPPSPAVAGLAALPAVSPELEDVARGVPPMEPNRKSSGASSLSSSILFAGEYGVH